MSRINYPLALIKGVVFDIDGVLSPSTVPMGADGIPQRMANIKDGYVIQLAIKCGLKLAIISGAKVECLAERFHLLGMQDVYLGASDKLTILRQWMQKENLRSEEVAFVGDDIPDIKAMKEVKLAVAPRDAASDVKEIAKFITQANGGYGVARELLEEILRAKGLWMNDATAFGW